MRKATLSRWTSEKGTLHWSSVLWKDSESRIDVDLLSSASGSAISMKFFEGATLANTPIQIIDGEGKQIAIIIPVAEMEAV